MMQSVMLLCIILVFFTIASTMIGRSGRDLLNLRVVIKISEKTECDVKFVIIF